MPVPRRGSPLRPSGRPGALKSPLPDLLDRYTALWEELGCPRASLLRPGLPAERVRRSLAAEGLTAHREIIDGFGWHDGTERAGTVTLPPPRLWVFTLGEALAERRRLLDFALQTSADIRRDEPDAGPEDPFTRADHWWRPPWLPIARGGGSEELAIDLSADRSPGLRY